MERRPATGQRIILTSTPATEIGRVAMAGHQLVSIRDVACHDTCLTVDPAILGARARVTPARVMLLDDDRVLTIGPERLIIRGEIQQSILRQLVDAAQAGRRLRTADVLRVAGSNADSLAKAFSGSPNWGRLKSVLRQESGMCWLEV